MLWYGQSKGMANILVVDDDEDVRLLLRALLEGHVHTVTEAEDGEMGIEATSESTDLIITDIQMPKVDALDLILVLKKRNPELPIIAISGAGQMAGAINTCSAEKTGADDAYTKPFDHIEMLSAVDRLLAQIGRPNF